MQSRFLTRLLIDLSWNSSRLGETYSLLDTTRLIELAKLPKAGDRLEAQMIVNHKGGDRNSSSTTPRRSDSTATRFSTFTAFWRRTAADQCTRRLRRMAVGIGKSAYHPLEMLN